MRSMPDDYVARFGWTRRDLLLLPVCGLFVVVGVAMASSGEMVMGPLAVLLGGGYLALSTTCAVSRRIALAVTEQGMTFGAVPPWPASRTAHVPWDDVESVVVWRQSAGDTSTRYIGVLRRAGAPPLPGSMRSRTLMKVGRALVPADVSEPLMVDSRPVAFWRLDQERLSAALHRYAPHVAVIDEG